MAPIATNILTIINISGNSFMIFSGLFTNILLKQLLALSIVFLLDFLKSCIAFLILDASFLFLASVNTIFENSSVDSVIVASSSVSLR